jgi:hypothetical protein
MLGADIAEQARGVGHNPDPVSPVLCIDGNSRYNERFCLVSIIFQRREHLVDPHRDVSKNILENTPSGPSCLNNSSDVRPEMSGVISPFSLPR